MALSLQTPRPIEPDPILLGREEDHLQRIEEKVSQLEETVKELESRFEAYNAALALYESRITSLEKFHTAASLVGAWKASTCIYQEGGICKLWRLTPEAAEKLADVVSKDDHAGDARVDVGKAPWFCGLCPLYKQAQHRQQP